MNRRTLLLWPAIPAAIAVAPGTLHAADRDPAADALFQQGRAQAASGQYARACPRFQENYRLDPTVGTLLNLADCTEPLGRIGTAPKETAVHPGLWLTPWTVPNGAGVAADGRFE